MRRDFLTKTVVAGAMIAILVGIGTAYWWQRKPARKVEKPKKTFDLPPLSSSPYLNTLPSAFYVGLKTCAECHEDQYRTYRLTAHSEALNDVDSGREPPDGSYTHAGLTYTVYRQNGQFRQRQAARDQAGNEYAAVDVPMRYRVGSGHHTRSYFIEEDGFLAESPITWYVSRHAWDMSPGYDAPGGNVGFQRPAEASCLFCHVGRLASPQGAFQHFTVLEEAIGCERCHGPGSLHVAEMRALPAGSKPNKSAPTIVHPKRLSRRLAEAICAQCHLNLDAGVNVRGRVMEDFRPGLPLSDFSIDYRFDQQDDLMKVVGHIDQLHQSKCYQGSEKLTCTTCHDPHTSSGPKEKHVHYLQVCMNCHTEAGCGLEVGERLRRNPSNDCVACHMPRVGTDIPHIAFTHHRIGIHEGESQKNQSPARSPNRVPELVPVEDVSRFSELDRQRNLGLAYFAVSQEHPEYRETYRERARQLLEGVRSSGLPDPEVPGILAFLYQRSDPQRAVDLAREAVASDKFSPKLRVNSLFLIAGISMQMNQLDSARNALDQLIGERRMAKDWGMLGMCRQRHGDLAGAVSAFEKAAAINPFLPQIHFALAQAYEGMGRTAEAQRERSIAARLASQERPNRGIVPGPPKNQTAADSSNSDVVRQESKH
jgi:predicted CXXCH cytochrome family protein